MKKILIALAVIASMQIANAQVKQITDAQKALDKAVEASQNEKKATKAATWQKLAEAYLAAYDAPIANAYVGANKTELKVLMLGDNPVSTENVVIGGEQMEKEVYANKNLYFDGNGALRIIEVTKPVVDNALEKALEAYNKMLELDAKTVKEAVEGLESVAKKYENEAYNQYSFGDYSASSKSFEKVADVRAMAPLSKVDTNSIYNAGFTSHFAKEYERAEKFFNKSLEIGNYGDGGEVYAKLADVKLNLKDTVAAKALLEEGFGKFHESQSILIGLINLYLSTNENPEKLFTLLDAAKENEPNNASLYYVEGNIRAQLGQYDNAVKAYEQCAVVDPSYEFGYIGEGIMYYNRAIELQQKASEELDDAKYMALVADFEVALKNCIEPFEKAYELTKGEDIKKSVAEYLKNAYYRFMSDDDPKYKAGYEKYSAIVAQ
ncbi:MAG: hypothetical protein II693_04580 [Bacteroidales bacterium]|nr:hypothetical protein [Bacteroidales bacterium]